MSDKKETYVDAGALGQILELGLHTLAVQAGHAAVVDQANSAAIGHVWWIVLVRHRFEGDGRGDRPGKNARARRHLTAVRTLDAWRRIPALRHQ